MNRVLLITSVIGQLLLYCQCANITQVEQLYSDLFSTYNRKLFPLIDHTQIVNIYTTAGLVSINNFDELSGQIELTIFLSMQWTDERLTWTPSVYGEKTTMLVTPEDIWRPKFYVIQSYNKIQEVGTTSQMLRLDNTGAVFWNTANVLKILCSVDVTYFPFDTQTCDISVSGWDYNMSELVFYATSAELDTSIFQTNSQWELISASVRNLTDGTSSVPPSVNISLKLKRRSQFFTVYIILPIVFLGFINNLVFVMPASSGERTSVAITTFLSFVVYMEMINNNVPDSSSPMAYIYFYVLFLLVYSSCIMMLSIISLRIHDRSGEVNGKIKQLVVYLRFWPLIYRRKSSEVVPRKKSAINDDLFPDLKTEKQSKDVKYVEEGPRYPEIDWKVVGKTYDRYCFFSLFMAYFIQTIVTFSNLYNNTGL